MVQTLLDALALIAGLEHDVAAIVLLSVTASGLAVTCATLLGLRTGPLEALGLLFTATAMVIAHVLRTTPLIAAQAAKRE